MRSCPFDTIHGHVGSSVDFSVLSGTVSLIGNNRAVCRVLINRQCQHTDVALLVTTAIDVVNASANDVGLGFALTVHIVGLSVVFIGGIAVLNGFVRICLSSTSIISSTWISCGCMIVAVVIISHVGTRVLIPYSIITFLDRIVVLTVTTTECLVYLVGCIDGEVGSWYGSSVATTIHLPDTGQGTTVDNHFRSCRCLESWVRRISICWIVFSKVATAIDCNHVVLLVGDEAS